jgi:acetyl-CoA C-acetyltransferase
MVLTDEEGGNAAAADGRPPAWVLGSSSRSEPASFPGRDPVRPVAALQCAADVYSQAGITEPRRQIETAELYVPFSWHEPIWLEAFGLADVGEGWKLVDDGTTELGGSLPINASGGVLSSNPIGASGLLRFAEAANQVRGAAGEHQVDGAKVAIGMAYGANSQYFSTWAVGSSLQPFG